MCVESFKTVSESIQCKMTSEQQQKDKKKRPDTNLIREIAR